MIIGANPVAYSRNATFDETDCSGRDIVIEATGKHHKKPDTLQTCFDQGVEKLIVAAPTEGALDIVHAINDHLFEFSHVKGVGAGINATIGFEELSQGFDKSSKSLMRMFGPKGNPQASSLFAVIHYLQEQEGIHLEVKVRKMA